MVFSRVCRAGLEGEGSVSRATCVSHRSTTHSYEQKTQILLAACCKILTFVANARECLQRVRTLRRRPRREERFAHTARGLKPRRGRRALAAKRGHGRHGCRCSRSPRLASGE